MRVIYILVMAGGLVGLAGCASTQQAPAYYYQRADGQPISGQLEVQAKLDKAACEGRVQQTAAGAPAIQPPPRNDAGTLGAGLQNAGDSLIAASRNIERSQQLERVFVGCMAEKGYIRISTDDAWS